MRRGVFISFEGSEGCGKSTQIAALKHRLESASQEVVVTREPGGTAIGEKIRHLLQFAPEGAAMKAETELLLFAASRAQLVRELIDPALAAGKHVLADRFHDSTTVYQGMARGLGVALVEQINAVAVGACVPDVTILLDMDSAAAHERALHSSAKKEGVRDRMESQPADFYEAVRKGYLTLAEREKNRYLVMDASLPVDELGARIWQRLLERFDGVFD